MGVRARPVPDPRLRGSTTDFQAIKEGYFGSKGVTSGYGIIPKGPDQSGWDAPHGREALSATPQERFRRRCRAARDGRLTARPPQTSEIRRTGLITSPETLSAIACSTSASSYIRTSSSNGKRPCR